MSFFPTSSACFYSASYRQLQLWLKAQEFVTVKLNSKKEVLIQECISIWNINQVEVTPGIEAEVIADVNEWEYCLLSNRPTPKADTCPSWISCIRQALFQGWDFCQLTERPQHQEVDPTGETCFLWEKPSQSFYDLISVLCPEQLYCLILSEELSEPQEYLVKEKLGDYCPWCELPAPDSCTWFALFFIWAIAILIILCAINPTVIAIVMFSWLIGINIISNFLSFQKELWRSPWVTID